MKPRRLWSLAFGLMVLPMPVSAQLPYDRTTFLNGFASSSVIWTSGYTDLSQQTPPSYLSQFVDLRGLAYPNVHHDSTYQGHLSTVGPFFAAGGQHVAVGHSLGSLVARGIYIHNSSGARPNITGIVALTPPHTGASLADNAQEAQAYFADVQRRIQSGASAARLTLGVLFLFTAWASAVFSVLLALPAALFFGVGTFVSAGAISNVDQFASMVRVPAIADLRTTSTTIQTLASRFEDGAIPRANIYGTIPFRNAVLRLAKSAQDRDYEFENTVKERNRGLKMFKWCKYAGYATIVMSSSARKCSHAAKALQRMDDQWVKYVNGWHANGKPRYVSFDGVVPNERSVYPSVNGLHYNAQLYGLNHINAYKTRLGLNQVATAMIQIGMVQIQPLPGSEPPPSDPVKCKSPPCPY